MRIKDWGREVPFGKFSEENSKVENILFGNHKFGTYKEAKRFTEDPYCSANNIMLFEGNYYAIHTSTWNDIMEIIREKRTAKKVSLFKEEGTAPFSVALNNPDCIFDSASGFETLREALIWACNHGGRFNIQITDKDAEFYHYSFDGKHLQKEVGYDEWEEVKLK